MWCNHIKFIGESLCHRPKYIKPHVLTPHIPILFQLNWALWFGRITLKTTLENAKQTSKMNLHPWTWMMIGLGFFLVRFQSPTNHPWLTISLFHILHTCIFVSNFFLLFFPSFFLLTSFLPLLTNWKTDHPNLHSDLLAYLPIWNDLLIPIHYIGDVVKKWWHCMKNK
jgi:hypothetical protein